MRTILIIIFLIFACAALGFGEAVIAQAQQEWKEFYNELDDAVRRFSFIAVS